jgi:CheY-like chemotaxis protein
MTIKAFAPARDACSKRTAIRWSARRRTAARGSPPRERGRPDIVLLDVHVPDTDGFAIAAELTGSDDAPIVVLTSSHDLGEFNRLVARSGARGFVAKADLSGAALEALSR